MMRMSFSSNRLRATMSRVLEFRISSSSGSSSGSASSISASPSAFFPSLPASPSFFLSSSFFSSFSWRSRSSRSSSVDMVAVVGGVDDEELKAGSGS
jgi:hypothetical protein